MLKKNSLAVACVLALGMMSPFAHADQKVTEQVLEHHLQSFGSGNVTAILADYTEDSIVVLPSGVLKGRAQITGLFTLLVAEFSKPGVTFNLTNTKVHDHVAYIIWTAETEDNTYTFATDTFIVKGGKITYQTVAFDVTPKS